MFGRPGPLWQVFDLTGNGIGLILAVAREVRTLGQVLAQKSVHFLVVATLPWAVRVAEVHRAIRAAAEPHVHCHFPDLVVRHALAHGSRDVRHLVEEGLRHVDRAGGFELRQLDEQEQPAVAFDQGTNRMGIGRAPLISSRVHDQRNCHQAREGANGWSPCRDLLSTKVLRAPQHG